MNNKTIISIIIVGALALGYVLGTGDTFKTATDTKTSQSASVASLPHQEGENSRIPGAHHIHAVTYDRDGNLLLGTHGGLFKSANGGKTWEKIQTKGSVNSDDWMSLVSDPRSRNVIFAGGHDLGVIKSEDGGTTWMRADEGIQGTDIHGLALSERNPALLFAYSVGSGVFKSADGGSSWKRIDDGPENPGVRAFAYMAVQTSMDKSMGWDNWGLLFAGTADGIYQSQSCFCGWVKTTDGFNNTTVYALATLHKDLRTMYAGTKDGLWKSDDEGKTWIKLQGMAGTPVTAIVINPDDAKELVAVTENGAVYRSENAGNSWQQMNQL